MPNIITGLGGPNGQYAWISDNVAEVLGLTAEQVREHRPTIIPLFPGTPVYDQILAQEKQAHGSRLTFRAWQIEVQNNNNEAVPLAVVALFWRDEDGELKNIFGAAWPITERCPACSQAPREAKTLRRAVLGLAREAASP